MNSVSTELATNAHIEAYNFFGDLWRAMVCASLATKSFLSFQKKMITRVMAKKVVYPGSFDPITLGHVDLIERLCRAFDEVIILIAQSSQKENLFTVEEKKDLITKSLPQCKNFRIDSFNGLTVDYLKKNNISLIARGLRAVVDYEYELTMANINKKLDPNIETLLIFASPEYYFISSRGVKEVARNRGSLEGLVPEVVIEPIMKKLGTLT